MLFSSSLFSPPLLIIILNSHGVLSVRSVESPGPGPACAASYLSPITFGGEHLFTAPAEGGGSEDSETQPLQSRAAWEVADLGYKPSGV